MEYNQVHILFLFKANNVSSRSVAIYNTFNQKYAYNVTLVFSPRQFTSFG